MDDHSRFCISAFVVERATARPTCDGLALAMRRHGVPAEILTDTRHIFTPTSLEQADANLVMGDIGGGTAQLHQQLVFRPIAGLARPETPIKGLYLSSASAHPGPGVHGACGPTRRGRHRP